MMSTLFTFTPDDGPAQDIEAFDVSVETLEQAVAGHLPDGAFFVRSRPLGDHGEPRNLLFRAARVSNVREGA